MARSQPSQSQFFEVENDLLSSLVGDYYGDEVYRVFNVFRACVNGVLIFIPSFIP